MSQRNISTATPKRAERKAIAKRFHAGEVQGRLQCRLPDHRHRLGRALPSSWRGPTKSEILFVQMVGRGLRTAEGKADCLILDHSDNHTRLGFVTDIHHEELNQGKEKPRQPERADRGTSEEMPKMYIPETAKDAAVPVLRVHSHAASKGNTPRWRAG